MEKYLISLDLDDTILNKKKKIPWRTVLAISRLFKNGHYVILNSGRHLLAILPYVKQLKMYNYYFSCCDGTCIYKVNHNDEITETIPYMLDTPTILSFMKECEKFISYAVLHTYTHRYFYKKENAPEFFALGMEKDVEIQSFSELNDKYFIGAIGLDEKYRNKLSQIMAKPKYKCFSFMYWGEWDGELHYDIQLAGSSKGTAMLDIAKKLKVKPENIIAFGDEVNDIPMLLKAHEGRLMPKASKLSDQYGIPCIEKDSDHDGVLRYLLKYHKNLFR